MTQFIGIVDVSAGKDTSKQIGQSSGYGGFTIGNESGFSVIVTMDGTGHSKSLYPGTVDFFPTYEGFSGTILFKLLSKLNNISTWPSAFLQIDAIGVHERVNTSAYPMPLPRQMSVGNTLTTVGATAGNIQNDGSINGTSIIEVTPSGAASSTIVMNNDGTLTIKGDVANVLTTLLQLIPGAGAGASSVKLGDAARQVEVLGTFLADVTSVFTGEATFNTDVKTNMIRDNVTGVDQIDLATAGVTFNNFLTLLSYLSLHGKVTTTNGTTSGTATLYEMVSGTGFKLALVQFSNCKFGVAGNTNVTLIATWNRLAFAFSTDIAPVAYANSGTGITMGQLNGLGVGLTGGTTSPQSIMGNNEIAGSNSSFAQLQYVGGDTQAAHNGSLLMIGT